MWTENRVPALVDCAECMTPDAAVYIGLTETGLYEYECPRCETKTRRTLHELNSWQAAQTSPRRLRLAG